MTNIDYLYNLDAAKNFFDKNRFVDKQLNFRIIKRGTIVPYVSVVENGRRIWEFGGVVDGDGRFIKRSVGKFGADDLYTPHEKVRCVPATVIYLGLFYPVWGHFITEGLRYFWFLTGEIFRRNFKDCKLVYIPYENKWYLEHMQNFRRVAELSSVAVDKLMPLSHPVQFENVILPDESFFMTETGRSFTAEYRETVDRIRNFALKNRTPTVSKKIYCFHGRRQIGEERIAEYFRSKGYAIVRPEKLTLDEQLNLLINADSFASTIGSCSHNSIFLRDGTETILIPRFANHFTDYQRAIDQVRSLNSNYVDSSLSIFRKGQEAICFIISKQLKRFFGDDFNGYSDDDFKILLTYLKNCMGAGLKFNKAAVKYYAPILQDFLAQLKAREDLLKAYGVTIN